MRWLAGAVALVLAVPGAAQEAGDGLAAFEPLLGNCYDNVSPLDGSVDRHCWTLAADGNSVRQTHEITGSDLDGFSGVAIYRVNPDTGIVGYTYSGSAGTKSAGTVQVDNGDLVFPDEQFTLEDGTSFKLFSIFRISGPDFYVSESMQQSDGVWGDATVNEFRRVEPDTAD